MLLSRALIKSFLPARAKRSHKGVFGRVLVIAGSEKMSGAAVLCARATLRVGAGITALALPKSCQCIAAAALPEMLTVPLPERKGFLSKTALLKLEDFIATFSPSLILLGPGFADHAFLLQFLHQCSLPCVIDAEALNALAKEKDFSYLKMPSICTPHPAEMRRLIQKPISEEKKQRILYAKELSQKTGGVCLLKGFETVITDGKKTYINTTGGPALAKGGSGDVLAGMIAGLWAQIGTAEGFNNASALKAAACGVYLHGLCGDLAAKKLTDRCVLAGDLLNNLPDAFRQVLYANK